jgi:hypothetical protein
MSAPTLSDICLPSGVTVVYDNPVLEAFYERLLPLMMGAQRFETPLSIVLRYKEKHNNDVVVVVNDGIFARLSTNEKYKDPECLVNSLLNTFLK